MGWGGRDKARIKLTFVKAVDGLSHSLDISVYHICHGKVTVG